MRFLLGNLHGYAPKLHAVPSYNWMGFLAVSMLSPADSRIDDKEYLHQYLREVVAHEMGHCMGLRHNFIASTYHSLEELKNGFRFPEFYRWCNGHCFFVFEISDDLFQSVFMNKRVSVQTTN